MPHRGSLAGVSRGSRLAIEWLCSRANHGNRHRVDRNGRTAVARAFSIAKCHYGGGRGAHAGRARISDSTGGDRAGHRVSGWPGRLEKLQSRPDIYVDGAHNPGAARELADFWQENFAGRKIFLAYGALRDKAVDEIAGLLFPHAAEVVFTEPRTSRAISAPQLSEIAEHLAEHSSVIPDAEQALDYLSPRHVSKTLFSSPAPCIWSVSFATTGNSARKSRRAENTVNCRPLR